MSQPVATQKTEKRVPGIDLLRKPALLIGLFSCFVIAGPFARVQTHNELWADCGYLSCMDGIALGCLAALLAARIRLNHKSNQLAAQPSASQTSTRN